MNLNLDLRGELFSPWHGVRIIGGILRIMYYSYDDPLEPQRQKRQKTEDRRQKQKTEAPPQSVSQQSVVNVVVVVVVVVTVLLSFLTLSYLYAISLRYPPRYT